MSATLRPADPPLPGLEAVTPLSSRRDVVPPATMVRGMWLDSCLRVVRRRGLFDTYLRYLPKPLHETVQTGLAATWLPLSVAEAHYVACEALALSPMEITEVGREMAEHTHSALLSVMMNIARTADATAWTVLAQYPGIFRRMWRGGAAGIWRATPREAVVEIVQWPCSRFAFTRPECRGVLQRLIERFAGRVLVHDVPELTSSTGLGFRVFWM